MELTDINVRLDWFQALDMVDTGEELSGPIQWGFSMQDLIVLGALHKAGHFREKIEDLLEDCNLHTYCSLLNEAEYDKYKKKVFEEWIEENAPFH